MALLWHTGHAAVRHLLKCSPHVLPHLQNTPCNLLRRDPFLFCTCPTHYSFSVWTFSWGLLCTTHVKLSPRQNVIWQKWSRLSVQIQPHTRCFHSPLTPAQFTLQAPLSSCTFSSFPLSLRLTPLGHIYRALQHLSLYQCGCLYWNHISQTCVSTFLRSD